MFLFRIHILEKNLLVAINILQFFPIIDLEAYSIHEHSYTLLAIVLSQIMPQLVKRIKVFFNSLTHTSCNYWPLFFYYRKQNSEAPMCCKLLYSMPIRFHFHIKKRRLYTCVNYFKLLHYIECRLHFAERAICLCCHSLLP